MYKLICWCVIIVHVLKAIIFVYTDLLFSFTEDDYRTNERKGFIELQITKSASVRLANPVSLVVLPLTLTDAESRMVIAPHADNAATGT